MPLPLPTMWQIQQQQQWFEIRSAGSQQHFFLPEVPKHLSVRRLPTDVSHRSQLSELWTVWTEIKLGFVQKPTEWQLMVSSEQQENETY